MTWLRVDDGFTRNRKVFTLTHPAFRLHVVGLCYCAANLTDGLVSVAALPMLLSEAQTARKYVRELESAALWIGTGPWDIKDYLEYNPSREKVLEDRRKASERQKRHRGSNAVTNSVTNAVSNGVSHASPSRPVVTKTTATEARTPAFAAVGWNERQQTEALTDYPRARAWLKHAQSAPNVQNAGALAWSGFNGGGWPEAPKRNPSPADVCSGCGQTLGEGHLEDCTRLVKTGEPGGVELPARVAPPAELAAVLGKP